MLSMDKALGFDWDAVTHDQRARRRAQTQKNQLFLLSRWVGIRNQERELIKKDGLSLLE